MLRRLRGLDNGEIDCLGCTGGHDRDYGVDVPGNEYLGIRVGDFGDFLMSLEFPILGKNPRARY